VKKKNVEDRDLGRVSRGCLVVGVVGGGGGGVGQVKKKWKNRGA